eukprot:gene8198-9757_t
MGGGRRYPYPKWVWSPAGGWWPNPTNWKRNAALYVGVTFTLAYFVAQYADANTIKYQRKYVVTEKGHDDHH